MDRILRAGLSVLAMAGCGDAPSCSSPMPEPGVEIARAGRLDLLFVIDDSLSMAEEQAALADELPRLIRILTSGNADEDGDNLDPPDFDGVRVLQLGVVTTDVGTGGHASPRATSRSSATTASCAGTATCAPIARRFTRASFTSRPTASLRPRSSHGTSRASRSQALVAAASSSPSKRCRKR